MQFESIYLFFQIKENRDMKPNLSKIINQMAMHMVTHI